MVTLNVELGTFAKQKIFACGLLHEIGWPNFLRQNAAGTSNQYLKDNR